MLTLPIAIGTIGPWFEPKCVHLGEKFILSKVEGSPGGPTWARSLSWAKSKEAQVGPLTKRQSKDCLFYFIIMAHCYIIFSKSLNKFYTGACNSSLVERIEKHNNHSYGNHRYTATASDWKLYLDIEATNYPHAIRLERKIKSMKSKVFIQNLKKYPELIQKIFDSTK